MRDEMRQDAAATWTKVHQPEADHVGALAWCAVNLEVRADAIARLIGEKV